jgi:hypothetical protein
MQNLFIALIILSLIVTLGFLASGVLGMLRGSEFNRKYGNLMMRGRVASQAFTVALLLAYFLLYPPGG